MARQMRRYWPALACALGLWAAVVTAVGEDSVTSNQFIDLRTHSIKTPYIEDGLQLRWFDFGGDTIVSQLSPDGPHISLTSDRPSQAGWLFSRSPLPSQSFRIDVEFKIHGSGSGLFGDGMAIWLTKERGEMGSVFGAKDRWNGLGIFIDTFANSRHSFGFPRVLAFPNDGTISYDHHSDGAKQHPANAACSAYIRDPGHATRLRLTYEREGKKLKVDLQYRGTDEWEDCFDLEELTLPDEIYLGFSALTGELSDSHEIIKVNTANLIPKTTARTQGKQLTQKTRGRGGRSAKSHGSGSGWFVRFLLTVVKVLAVVAFLAVAYMAWTQYQAQTRNKRF